MTKIALSMDIALFLLLLIITFFPPQLTISETHDLAATITIGLYLVINAVALYLEVWRK